ncbi:MAG: signal peptidase I [Lachnospiraceae bacterium]|nr:signal peptidase I [Lachnospiraceae bacterium]
MEKKENELEENKNRPDVDQLEAELTRVEHNIRFRKYLRNTIYTLIVVAACAVLVAVIFLPVLRIYGSSMTPTLNEGDIVLSIKNTNVKRGDVVGVYYGSKVLIKRCIATSLEWVDIDNEGNVIVNGEMLDEPYLTEKALGETNIDLPFQVPENTIFVMGDHRATSIDSRNTSVGCISTDDVVGKIVFRVWPLKGFGGVD